MAINNLTYKVNSLLNPSREDNTLQYRNKVNRMYGIEERRGFNPFLNSDGSLKYANMPDSVYQTMLDKGTNDKVKEFITQATGLRPATVNTTTATDSDGNYAGADGTISFNANVDESNLASLDIATELPKLSTDQISAIISKHFGKSTVIKPSDAAGIYNAQQKTGMSALAILGIGALESGYGTSNIAKQKNNLWGWTAYNVNPGGNATTFKPIAEGALDYATKYMNTFYNKYGAKSIYAAGTGNNPAGLSYAVKDDGKTQGGWTTSVGSIMKILYQTAKGVGNFVGNYGNKLSGGGSSQSKVVNIAKQYLGTPYVWGGTSPKGFDCSGLMQYAYKQMGITIPRVSQDQFKSGTAVDRSQLQPGDLVFFKGSSGTTTAPGHVGMYIGNGQFIQAPKTGDVVKISNLSDRRDYVGARRYIGR